jgi:hypothetical protein
MRQLEFFDTALIQNLDKTKRGPENTLGLIDCSCNLAIFIWRLDAEAID